MSRATPLVKQDSDAGGMASRARMLSLMVPLMSRATYFLLLDEKGILPLIRGLGRLRMIR